MNIDGPPLYSLRIYENDYDNVGDYHNFFDEQFSYWVPMITMGTPDNPVNRIVFTTTGTVNTAPDPNPFYNLSDQDAGTVRARFTGMNENYTDHWLRIFVSLPTEGPERPIYSPRTQTFHVEFAAPFVTFNGIQKGGDNHYGGWAIWNFGVDSLVQDRHDRHGLPNDQIPIWVHYGIKGLLFQVVRVAYSLTVAGRVVPTVPR